MFKLCLKWNSIFKIFKITIFIRKRISFKFKQSQFIWKLPDAPVWTLQTYSRASCRRDSVAARLWWRIWCSNSSCEDDRRDCGAFRAFWGNVGGRKLCHRSCKGRVRGILGSAPSALPYFRILTCTADIRPWSRVFSHAPWDGILTQLLWHRSCRCTREFRLHGTASAASTTVCWWSFDCSFRNCTCTAGHRCALSDASSANFHRKVSYRNIRTPIRCQSRDASRRVCCRSFLRYQQSRNDSGTTWDLPGTENHTCALYFPRSLRKTVHNICNDERQRFESQLPVAFVSCSGMNAWWSRCELHTVLHKFDRRSDGCLLGKGKVWNLSKTDWNSHFTYSCASPCESEVSSKLWKFDRKDLQSKCFT